MSSSESWIDKIYDVNFLLNRFVYPMGRKVLGLGTTLCSSGVCFSTDILREFPWQIDQYPSVLEYGFDLQLKGIEIDFASSALVFTKITPSSSEVNNYPNTPSASSYHLIKKYVPQLLSTKANIKSIIRIGILLELVSPKLANLILLIVAMGLINTVLWWVGWVSVSALLIWLVVGAVAILSIPVALMVTDAPQKFLKSLMYLPITVYTMLQDSIQKYQKEDPSIIELKKKDNGLRVSDESKPVQ